MSEHSLLADLYRSALPPLPDEPIRQMPRRLYTYVWRVSRRQQIRLALITALVFPLSLAPLELQRRIIDDAISGGDLNLLGLLGALYLVVLLLHGGLKYLRNVYQNRTAEGVVRLLRLRIADVDSFEGDVDDGTRQAMIAAESEKIGAFVGESVSFPFLQAGVVASIAGYMLVVQPLVAAVAIGFFVPSLILVPILQQKVNRYAERRTVLVRELGKSVLAHDGKTGDDDGPSALIERIYRVRLRIFTLKYLMKFLNNLIGHLGPLSVLMVGGWLVVQGDARIGVIVAFISGYERMTNPARDLLNFYRRLSTMRIQYRLVREASIGDGS